MLLCSIILVGFSEHEWGWICVWRHPGWWAGLGKLTIWQPLFWTLTARLVARSIGIRNLSGSVYVYDNVQAGWWVAGSKQNWLLARQPLPFLNIYCQSSRSIGIQWDICDTFWVATLSVTLSLVATKTNGAYNVRTAARYRLAQPGILKNSDSNIFASRRYVIGLL